MGVIKMLLRCPSTVRGRTPARTVVVTSVANSLRHLEGLGHFYRQKLTAGYSVGGLLVNVGPGDPSR
jgi:hypothetical protein